MKRLGICAVLALLTACAQRTPESASTPDSQPEVMASGAVCRIGPDGGPVLADRGIGGTGAPQVPARIADRGIGGTGIVGVIRGFASICVNGIEVQYDRASIVDIDGVNAPPSALRVGQIVMIEADNGAVAPHAKTISVRNEMIGQIESIELGSGLLTIAGQSVLVPDETYGATRFGLGDWVTVSGLRRTDGVVVATRLEAADVDTLKVHGPAERQGSTLHIGALQLDAEAAGKIKNGQFVTVSGHYSSGRPHITAVTADRLFPDPAAYFGDAVNRLVVQAFIKAANGSFWLNGIKLNVAPDVYRLVRQNQPGVVSLERKPDGTFTAVGLRYLEKPGQGTTASRDNLPAARTDVPPPRIRHSTTIESHGADPVATSRAVQQLDGAAADTTPQSMPWGGTSGWLPTADIGALSSSPSTAAVTIATPAPVNTPVPVTPPVSGPVPVSVSVSVPVTITDQASVAGAPSPSPSGPVAPSAGTGPTLSSTTSSVPIPTIAVPPAQTATPQNPTEKAPTTPSLPPTSLLMSNNETTPSVPPVRSAAIRSSVMRAASVMRGATVKGSFSTPTISLVTGSVGTTTKPAAPPVIVAASKPASHTVPVTSAPRSAKH